MRGILNNIEQKHVPANYWSTLHKKWKWKKAEDNVYISIRKMSLSLTEKKNIFRIHPQHVSLPIILYIILFLVGYFVWFFLFFYSYISNTSNIMTKVEKKIPEVHEVELFIQLTWASISFYRFICFIVALIATLEKQWSINQL